MHLTPQKFCNVVYTWAVKRIARREQWEWDLPSPLAVKSSTITKSRSRQRVTDSSVSCSKSIQRDGTALWPSVGKQ